MHETRPSQPNLSDLLLTRNHTVVDGVIDELTNWDSNSRLQYPTKPLEFGVRAGDVHTQLDDDQRQDMLTQLYTDYKAGSEVPVPYRTGDVIGHNVVRRVSTNTEHDLFFVEDYHDVADGSKVLQGVRISAIPPVGYEERARATEFAKWVRNSVRLLRQPIPTPADVSVRGTAEFLRDTARQKKEAAERATSNRNRMLRGEP